MNAAILSVGSELMEGRIADTNAAFLSDRLTSLGFRVMRHVAVGDRSADIVGAIDLLAGCAKAVMVTGGIGPTPDDLTRQCFAQRMGVGMEEDAAARRHIEEIFAARGLKPSPSNAIQAMIPVGAQVIPNPAGTAAGFAATVSGCRFFSMPGVPSEMKAMFEQTVAPALRGMTSHTILVRSLHTYGLGESIIGERLAELMAEGHEPAVATQARDGIITVRITSLSAQEAETRRGLEATEAEVRRRLGEAVFGADEETLAGATVRALQQRQWTLAVAESCTGGAVADMLTSVPGVSATLLEGAVVYSNSAKTRRLGVPEELIARHGAVSGPVAQAMAEGMRRTSGADVAISTTGIAGPDGATAVKPVGLVYVGIAWPAGSRTEECRLFGVREQIKDRAAKRALNLLRLHANSST